MRPIEIFVADPPLPEHRKTITRLLDAYNDTRSGLHDPIVPLAVLLRAEGSDIIVGGLWGVSYWGWLIVEQLFVPETHRAQGIGTALLQRAEASAKSRGCIGVWLLSFSFQTPDFYRNHGYQSFGQLEQYPPGHQCTYFMTRLT
jgi:GNAT superfamily N-acetyltransferase